jgi:hypothetical protein
MDDEPQRKRGYCARFPFTEKVITAGQPELDPEEDLTLGFTYMRALLEQPRLVEVLPGVWRVRDADA